MSYIKNVKILEKIIYITIAFIVVIIISLIVSMNKEKIETLLINKSGSISTMDYSKDFNINSLKIQSLKRNLKENKNFLTRLVNKDNSIGKDYIPDITEPNISMVGRNGEEKNKVSSQMTDDLEKMFNDAYKEGVVDMLLNSAYRSYTTQEDIYNSELIDKKVENSNLVAKPGSSEHQTGLAVDITTASINFNVDRAFEDTHAYKWLIKNAHKYGFVLRYPKDKTYITKYEYEPWHFRYLGDKKLATYVYENNLTLEELHETLDSN